jgi:SAM-dependent methyltransferase
MMKPSLLSESENLKKAWASKTSSKLRTYLVSGIQDPRSNIQSILTRHFLIRQLFGHAFDELAAQELWHAMKLNSDRTDNRPVTEEEKEQFQSQWRDAMAQTATTPISVLEAACGSANDYRFFDAYGLARFLRYSGFDLSESNIVNAREMFPGIDFRCGNVFEISREDASEDFVIAFDLFEHLSLEGVDAALNEVCRVAGRGLVLNLFNASEIVDHVSNPVPERHYHWNTLSLRKVTEFLCARASSVEVVHIHGMLSNRFGEHREFDSFLNDLNPNLYTFYVSK